MKRMSNALAIALTIAGLYACNSQNKQQQGGTQHPNLKSENLADLAGEYEFNENGDTIHLQLQVQQDSLVGNLTYALREKDKNVGTFRGVVQDSLIVGSYYFQSEGMNSKRETVLGILPDGLVEGFGDVQENEEGMSFVDRNNLRFDHGMLLQRK